MGRITQNVAAANGATATFSVDPDAQSGDVQ